MQNPSNAAVRGYKKNSQLCATLFLSLATISYFVGYIVLIVTIKPTGSEGGSVPVTGIVLLVSAVLMYVTGFFLYKHNSGKPHFVGYVLQNPTQGFPCVSVYNPLQQGPAAVQTFAVYPPQEPEPAVATGDEPPKYDDALVAKT